MTTMTPGFQRVCDEASARCHLRDVVRQLEPKEVPIVAEYIQRLIDSRTTGTAWVDPIEVTHG